MIYSRILGTGSYLPEHVLTNEELAKKVETSDEWITKRVGIRERHLVAGSGDTTSTMSTAAAREALAAANVSADQIDMIIVATATADNFFPSAACQVQDNLGVRNECPAFDVNAACAGFIYAMSVAEKFIRLGELKHVLVIGAEALSTTVDWTDRSTCVLFGDGAGAVVLGASDEPGIFVTKLHAAGEYGQLIYATSSLWDKDESGITKMSGREVFKLAVTKLGDIVEQTVGAAGLQKSDIDWLIPHQANMRIIQAMAKRLELPMERVVLTIEHHGNTSAASIPLALDHAVREGTIKRGEVLLLDAFGAGLAWGSALVKY